MAVRPTRAVWRAGWARWGAMGRGMTIAQMESGFIASDEYYARV